MDQHPWTAPEPRRDLTPYGVHHRRPLPRAGLGEPALRVGEAERAAACDALAEHYASGRLDPAELDDRLARAVAARSQADLRILFDDLGPRRPVPDREREPADRVGSGALVPVLAALMVVSLLLAGGMLLALAAYDVGFFVAALLGGTATGVAGACAAVVAQATWRRR